VCDLDRSASIGLLVGEYLPEVAESSLKFSFYAFGVFILSYICMYSGGVMEYSYK